MKKLITAILLTASLSAHAHHDIRIKSLAVLTLCVADSDSSMESDHFRELAKMPLFYLKESGATPEQIYHSAKLKMIELRTRPAELLERVCDELLGDIV